MFSLIITIISIALVAALAVATIYYGGSAFTQGTAKANASALVSAAQQVQGADTLFQNDNGGANAEDVAALVSGSYLQAAPTMPAGIAPLVITNGVVTANMGNNLAVCEAVIKSAGGAAADGSVTVGATKSDERAYDCFSTAEDSYTFQFGG